jgi:hypothetical protein
MLYSDKLEKLHNLVRILPQNVDFAFDSEPRVVAKTIREILDLLPDFVSESKYQLERSALFSKEVNHLKGSIHRKYRKGIEDIREVLIRNIEPDSPTSKRLFEDVIDQIDIVINHLKNEEEELKNNSNSQS